MDLVFRDKQPNSVDLGFNFVPIPFVSVRFPSSSAPLPPLSSLLSLFPISVVSLASSSCSWGVLKWVVMVLGLEVELWIQVRDFHHNCTNFRTHWLGFMAGTTAGNH